MERFDRERLTKCEGRLVAMLENCTNRDKMFEIEVIMRESATDKDRQRLRKVLSVKDTWPRIFVGGAKLENIYAINDLKFVQSILVAGKVGVASRYVKESYPSYAPPKRTLWQRFRDMIDKILIGTQIPKR